MNVIETNQISANVAAPRDRWIRSSDGMIAGVCAGLAKATGMDTWVIRLLWLLTVLAFGTGVLAYFILAYTLPREDKLYEAHEKRYLGVCWQISKQTGYEVGVIRALTVTLALASFGATILAYLIMYVLMNKEENSRKVVL